jgi:hypothetical protein
LISAGQIPHVRDCLGHSFRGRDFVHDAFGIRRALSVGNHNPGAAEGYDLGSKLTKASGPADDHSSLICELTAPHHRG